MVVVTTVIYTSRLPPLLMRDWGFVVVAPFVQLDLWDVDGARGRPHCGRSDHGDGDGEACRHGALCRQEGVHDQGRDDKGGNQSTAGCKSQTLSLYTLSKFNIEFWQSLPQFKL